jgi:hypothetical protein
LHTDSIDGGHEASYGLGHVPGRGRTPTLDLALSRNSRRHVFRACSEYARDVPRTR